MAYYQDQYTAEQKKPLPPPDINWVDHVQENKKYLKKIQKSSVFKEFEGLKDAMLFVMEVSIDSVEFNKTKSDALNAKHCKLYVKFLDFSIWEITGKSDHSDKPKECSSYSDFFQNIFTTTKPNVPVERSSKTASEKEKEKEVVKVEQNSETKRESTKSHKKIKGKKESKGSKDSDKSKEVKAENEKQLNEPKDTKEHEVIKETKVETSKGKAALFVMKGVELIRKLQEYPIDVKVTRNDEKKEDTKTEFTSGNQDQKKSEEVVLGTTAFRVPESFRVAVLSFVGKNTTLPSREKHSDTYKLTNTMREEVGKVDVTVTLTCLGKVVENCIREQENDAEKYTYEHMKCWRTFTKEKGKIPKIDPELATHLIKTAANISPRNMKSEEILRHCIGWGGVKVDDEERRRALGRNNCDWHRLVKQIKSEIDSKYEENEFIRPFNTAMKQKSPRSSWTEMNRAPRTYKSVIELTTTVVSSKIIASRTFVNQKPDWSL